MGTQNEQTVVTGDYVELHDERYFRIANSHAMPEFFMSLVGASDHWMFISSRGALTAGRRDPDLALFPYAADDQISVARDCTGPVTVIRDTDTGRTWEPFRDPHADNGASGIVRNLYKTPLGDKLVFEEISRTQSLAFRYRWTFSERFGFVRSCYLENAGTAPVSLTLLDGLQNILPFGVGSDFMMRFSNLANAYKKSELLSGSGLGLYYLSSIPTDRAEPSEGLRATSVWQTGLTPDATLLSVEQLQSFRHGQPVRTEVDERGKCGAYLVSQSVRLEPGETLEWHIVAELAQDHTDFVQLDDWLLQGEGAAAALQEDIEAGEQRFRQIVASADGLQCGENARRANRHLSNTVFNVMRGGIPLEHYSIQADDFRTHVSGFNRGVSDKHAALLVGLPSELTAAELRARLEVVGDADLARLGMEYLPLAFSRRHGDPTRPWNRFAIHLRSPDGKTNLNYQGNWRDIFQNWEALAVSFPDFTTSMICRFVNATTADGYNPYRVTKDGFEWEEPTPEDPWANIGYWGDHQIVYLLKLLEWNSRVEPAGLAALLNLPVFVHAHVPYRIRDFEHIRQDPQSTITFDAAASDRIAERVAEIGADGKLLQNQAGEIHHVTLMEKLLTLSLAKLSNFVPDGGIWLNTQRPEWNDANNALVGHGLSMVTACYLYRWFGFIETLVSESDDQSLSVSAEVAEFFRRIDEILSATSVSPGSPMEPSLRGHMVELLSRAGSDYRNALYESGPSGQAGTIDRTDCLRFFETARRHLEATITNNRRADGLFHSYNLLNWRDDGGLDVEHLYEMLEGQVAVLSSGLLSADDCVALLNALRSSALYRENQDSYLLYPDRQLPRFLEKNQIDDQELAANQLLQQLLEDGNESIVRRDVRGGVHFSGDFRNSADLKSALSKLPDRFSAAVKEHAIETVQSFENLFGHRQFTGRSGTFFAYEGLGSIYWHMVSKLGLSVCENFFAATESGANRETLDGLRNHFQAVRAGIGAEKSPADYGAFPTDPYSHTPENAGVKQPGMTGQVKEDILSRFAELGIHIEDGCIQFRMDLFDQSELLRDAQDFRFCGLDGAPRTLSVPEDAFAFTLCQTPILLRRGDADGIEVRYANGERRSFSELQIDQATSRSVFARRGEIELIECHIAWPQA